MIPVPALSVNWQAICQHESELIRGTGLIRLSAAQGTGPFPSGGLLGSQGAACGMRMPIAVEERCDFADIETIGS